MFQTLAKAILAAMLPEKTSKAEVIEWLPLVDDKMLQDRSNDHGHGLCLYTMIATAAGHLGAVASVA